MALRSPRGSLGVALALTAGLTAIPAAAGAGVRLGVQGGAALASHAASSDDSEESFDTGTRTGPSAGLVLDIDVRDRVWLRLAPGWVEKGSTIELEFFGTHQGRFERADGGTLFLDELGTMSMRLQEKLLRLVEYGEFERLGGQQTIQVDVRVIAATNVDLEQAVDVWRSHVRVDQQHFGVRILRQTPGQLGRHACLAFAADGAGYREHMGIRQIHGQ